MKNLFIIFIVILLPLIGLAAEEAIDPFKILDNIAKLFSQLVLAVSVIMFIYAGYIYVVHGGESEEVETAKKIMLYATVGIGIAILTFGLVGYIIGFFS
ncbi:MAG: hypothetical protein HYV52_02405 [Parcubacteria group bacterium]|nr:hypothetical protein [Parcubacteria group bacterium]